MGWMSKVQFPAGAGIFFSSPPCSDQTDVAYSASYSMGTSIFVLTYNRVTRLVTQDGDSETARKKLYLQEMDK
jgi:hypothetical protein